MFIGPHIVFSNILEFKNEIDYVKKNNGNIVQFFKTDIDDLGEIKKYSNDNNIKTVIHSSYTHNIASDWDKYSWWIMSIINEIIYCDKIGSIGIVLHFGKQKELKLEQAINNMFTSLLYIHNKTIKQNNVKIILETPAGQGTEMCYKIEDLTKFFNKFIKIGENKKIKKRFKICIDTCHIFSAGYDLRTKNAVKLYFDRFNEYIGIEYIYLIHLNDSKTLFGSRLDRHEIIGKGSIGLQGLKYIFKLFNKNNVAMIMEIDKSYFKSQLKLLIE